MSCKVTVVCKGAVDYEVSGGDSGTITKDTKTFSIGQQGSMVQFLTLKRKEPGDISVKSKDGAIKLEIDGPSKTKNINRGGSFKMASKGKRLVIFEKV